MKLKYGVIILAVLGSVASCSQKNTSTERVALTAQVSVSARDYVKESYAYIHKKDWTNAIVAAEQAKALDPKNADAYLNLAYSYVMLREYARVMEPAQKAIDLGAKHPAIAYNYLGFAYFKLGKNQEALKNLEKAVANNSKNTWAQVYLKKVQAAIAAQKK